MPNSWSFTPQPKPAAPAAAPAAPAAAAVVPDPAVAEAAVVEQYQPSVHTVTEVQAYVEGHPDELEAVLALEEIGKRRTTLLAWLTELQASYAAEDAAADDDGEGEPVDDDG